MTAVNIEKVHARLDIKQPLDEYVLILGSRSSSIHYNETQESSPGGEIGRRKGLKILFLATGVWVQFPPRAPCELPASIVFPFVLVIITSTTRLYSLLSSVALNLQPFRVW